LAAATPGVFTADHIEIAREVAVQLAVAIQNARLFEQVQAGRRRLQALSRQLVEAQETERRRLARELHDEIGQSLTVTKINLQAMQRIDDASVQAKRLEEGISIVERALQQVRNMSLDLRPSLLDDLGLVAALRWFLDRQAQTAGFSTQFVADPPELRLTPALETVCFRLVQEALTNVIRHAQAQQVQVELRQREAELYLTIHDDGIGFDVKTALKNAAQGGSLGLLGMEERVLLAGGYLEIDSVPERGTEIRVRFPLNAPSKEGEEK
jgi:signal transduction histidine kinase